jgi:hypothetical protein
VIIWLNQETASPLRPRTREAYQAHLAQLRAHYAAVQQPLVNLLKANGQRILTQPSAPLVGAEVTPSLIRRIAERPDVVRIYLDEEGAPRGDISQVVVQANTVNEDERRREAVEANQVSTYPPQVLRVFPPQASTQGYVNYINASMNFTLGGGADAASLQFLVDGVDVTKQSTIVDNQDVPPSSLNISYNPIFSEVGTHCAELRFQTLAGKPTSYDWCFSVASVTPRPPQIQSVSPPEELTQTEVRYVGANFEFQLGEGVNPSSMQLFLDGVDVTNQSEISSTRDGCTEVSPTCPPPSSGGIFYTLNRLEPGTHQVEIRFQTLNGTPQSYKWSFSVESPSPSR